MGQEIEGTCKKAWGPGVERKVENNPVTQVDLRTKTGECPGATRSPPGFCVNSE